MDATPEVEASLKDELEKVDRVYSAAGKDMTQFPTFSFKGNCSLGVCVYFVVLYFARTGLHSCVCVYIVVVRSVTCSLSLAPQLFVCIL